MDDRRSEHQDLEHLLRMAHEVDALEAWDAARAKDAPTLRLVGAAGGKTAATEEVNEPVIIRQVRSRHGLKIALAAAACLTLTAGGIAYWATSLASHPTPHAPAIAMAPIQPTPRVVSTPELTPEAVAALVRSIDPSMVARAGEPAEGPPRESVILAIVEDEPGKVRCVQWTDHDWGKGRHLADVDSGELLTMSTALSCDENPARVVVVGLEGPPDSLPRGQGAMNLLAECILQSPAACPSDSSSYRASAVQCLPGDLHVKVESLAMEQ